MKNVKKIIAMVLALMMVVSMAACNKGEPDTPATTAPVVTEPVESTTPVESTPEVTTEVDPTEVAPTEDETNQMSDTEEKLLSLFEANPTEFGVMTWALDITDAEALKSFTGLYSTEGLVEVSVTEPMMSSQAYSVVLAKAQDAEFAASIAEAMKNNIDTAKWVCVEADTLEVAVVDEYVLLAMMSSDFAESVTAQGTVDAFVAMMGTADAPVEDVVDNEPVGEIVEGETVADEVVEEPTEAADTE